MYEVKNKVKVFKIFPLKKMNKIPNTAFSKSDKICYLSCRHTLKRKRQDIVKILKSKYIMINIKSI